jgi:putative oxidoreductase
LIQLITKLRNIFFQITGKLQWLPPTLTRLSVGALFVFTGWGKITHIDKIVEYFAGLNIPAPEIQARLAAFSELGCGALLVVGLLTRLASIPLIVIMIVAILTAKLDDIHSFNDFVGSSEYLFILLLIYLVITGPGPLSLDKVLKKKFFS